MTFEEWLRENDVDRDEYYSIGDMRWFAEQAWNAAVRTMMDQERKGQDNKPLQSDAIRRCEKCGCGLELIERLEKCIKCGTPAPLN